jgi:hypothetical protein
MGPDRAERHVLHRYAHHHLSGIQLTFSQFDTRITLV